MKTQVPTRRTRLALFTTLIAGSFVGYASATCEFGCMAVKCMNFDSDPNYTEPCFGTSDWTCKASDLWYDDYFGGGTCTAHPTATVDVYACDMCTPDCPTRDPSAADPNSCLIGTQGCQYIGTSPQRYCGYE